MASAKIHINLSQGLIEAEGEETFVRTIYDDFKGRLNSEPPPKKDRTERNVDQPGVDDPRGTKVVGNSRKRAAVKKVNTGKGDGEAKGITSYTPKRDPSLDLSKLKPFMAQYAPKSNPDKYVLYIHYLKDALQKDPCTIDQVYSCFLHMRDRLPKFFGQNLVDTKNNNGYITFSGPYDITLTTVGLNHFNIDMPKKAAE